jgi:aspartyl-tRNA(Asn)/glutamyl-tRNA(Gln) amidotransferase subunit A
MHAAPILDLHLFQLADRIRRGDVSPVTVTEAALAWIETVDPRLNAFVTVVADDALEAARAAERDIAAGRYRGPLHGVPVGVKDLCETAGVRTTAGSALLADWIPDRDAAVVRKLRAAGAVIVGKLNLHELAYGVTGVNTHTGTVRNPWDPERITGGSSSGSAAAVAARECFAALGTDTGCSVRIPASLCGVVGLKPTHGRVSLHGVVPLAPSLDHVGPLARCVRDVALVLQAIAGHDPEDPRSAEVPVADYTAHLDAGARPLRIGVISSYALDGCDPEVSAAVAQVVEVFRALGARCVETDGRVLSDWWIANMTIVLAEAAEAHRGRFDASPERFGEDVRRQLQAGMELQAVQYVSAARMRDALRRGVADEALFGGADVLITPTSLILPPRIADLRADDPLGVLTHNTAPFDLSGHPAISVPCGYSETGLPIGVQIVGRHWDEATVLRAAAAYERERGPMRAPSVWETARVAG